MKINRFPKDNFEEISEEEWNKAIEFLINYLPKETFMEIWETIKKSGKTVAFHWAAKFHMDFGLSVRNALRKGSFDWGDISLDSNWHRLAEDAIRNIISEEQGEN